MKLPFPLIIINLKTYEAGSDVNAEQLARSCEQAAKAHNAGVALACQAADLFRLSRTTSLPLLCQHVDPDEYGAHTGAVLIETARCNGAAGSIINHSEKPVSLRHIKAVVEKSRRLGFISVVCAKNSTEVKRIAKLQPDYIAVEPPELIGGKVSVSTARPGLIKTAVKTTGKASRLLVGAGVHTSHDLHHALHLGAAGVLLASGIVQAQHPGKVLHDLLKGSKTYPPARSCGLLFPSPRYQGEGEITRTERSCGPAEKNTTMRNKKPSNEQH